MTLLTRTGRDPLMSVFDHFFTDPDAAVQSCCTPATTKRTETALMPLDVSETDTEVVVRASVPGFEKNEIDAELHDNVLTVKAERKSESSEQRTGETGERYFRRELRWGSTARSVALGCPVQGDKINAELKNGILTLRLPKIPEATPRKIRIG